uniref:Thiamine transporter 2 n=1 Tax=Syphacia muris TaxID=451379 RepID=A0A0N5AH12_9BILA
MRSKLIIVMACLYGIVKEFRPATPFLTPYLISPVKNFTNQDLYAKIYPFWTYSYLVALIPIFFLTDILRYKPIVCLEALTLCGTWALLIWGNTVKHMQLMQIIFGKSSFILGIASASGIAYYSYVYAAVDEKDYKKVTSFTRSAVLIGKFFSYGIAQLLVIYFGHSRYLLLNQISFGALVTVVVIAFALPSISLQTNNENQLELKRNNLPQKLSQNYLKDNQLNEKSTLLPQPPTIEDGIVEYLTTIWKNFKIYKTDTFVLKWSIWWALTSCGVFQVQNYMQSLWATMQRTDKDVKNGVSECFNTLIGALLSYVIQYWNINWESAGEYVLLVTSLLSAVLLLLMAKTTSIIVSYIVYSVIVAVYHTLTTAASANIASHLNKASYGLVFGWNTFIALILQTVLTIAVADEHGFNLDIRTQFVVYGCYFGAIAILFASIAICKVLLLCCRTTDERNLSTIQDAV